jgi:rRNA-processing protein FCF1
LLQVIADTSFLIYIANHPTPILRMLEERVGAYRLIVPTPVLEELERLVRGGGKRARQARAALRYAENLPTQAMAGTAVDDALIAHAKAHGLALATLDGALLRKARGLGITTISARRGRLWMEGVGRNPLR